MYRTELIHLNKIRMDESLSFGEDTVFVTEYISHCNSMRVIDTICYNYYDIGEDYINKYKDYNDSIYDYCYKIREKYALLDEKFGLRGCRIVYGFIFDIFKLNIDEGRGDIKKFRELLLLKEVQDTLNERNSLYIKMMLFSAKSLYLLKVYLWIIRLIKQYV